MTTQMHRINKVLSPEIQYLDVDDRINISGKSFLQLEKKIARLIIVNCGGEGGLKLVFFFFIIKNILSPHLGKKLSS